MWMISAGISVLFCAIGWILTAKKNEKAVLASGCSLAFVAVTLLLEYWMVLNWVKKEDWAALLDVVPSAFTMLCGYVIVLIFANILSIFKMKKE